MYEADIAAGLRAAARQEGATIADAVAPSVPETSPEPASEPTAEAAPAETPEPSPEPSAPSAEAEIQSAPETPAAEPSQSFDLAEVLKSTGYDTTKYASPQEALTEILAQMRRTISEQGEKLKAQPSAAPATAQPAQAQTAPPVPAPPAPAATSVADQVNAEVKARLAQDNDVTQALTTYKANTERISTITRTDIPKIQQEIARLEAWLPENAKALGLPEPDEFTASQAASRIRDLQAQFRLLRLEAADLNQVNTSIRNGYQQREALYRNEIEGRHQEALRAEQEEAELDRQADEFVGKWNDAFASVIAKHGITDEVMKRDIWNHAEAAGNARPSEVKELASFIERFAKEELDRADRYRRDAARVNAERKKADVASQAPVGPAAVAPSARKPSDNSDPFAALRAAERNRYSGAAV